MQKIVHESADGAVDVAALPAGMAIGADQLRAAIESVFGIALMPLFRAR